jgi:hypothetical protein
MTDERVKAVLDNLSSLIVSHAGMTAREQYAPNRTADDSDDYIQAHTEWVRELRDIRHRFENLITGLIDESPK